MHDCTQLMYQICLSETLILNDKNVIFLQISNSIISFSQHTRKHNIFLQQYKKKNKPPKKAQGFYFKNQYTVTCAINSARIIKTKFDLC